jgi:membrane protease YdiL (CAAX protease family)
MRLSSIITIFKPPPVGRPGLKDIIPFFSALGCLLLTAVLVSAAASFLPDEKFTLSKPAGITAWAKITVYCLLIGYWEEGFFRMYFLTVCRRAGIEKYAAVLISSLVFASCHYYEGIPGMVNAAIAGVSLSVIYLKTASYHGLALAHSAYNILAYILA